MCNRIAVNFNSYETRTHARTPFLCFSFSVSSVFLLTLWILDKISNSRKYCCRDVGAVDDGWNTKPLLPLEYRIKRNKEEGELEKNFTHTDPAHVGKACTAIMKKKVVKVVDIVVEEIGRKDWIPLSRKDHLAIEKYCNGNVRDKIQHKQLVKRVHVVERGGRRESE